MHRLYQRLKSSKYKRYGDIMSLLPEIAAQGKFTKDDVLLQIPANDRRNILSIFHYLELIKVIDGKAQIKVFAPSETLKKFLKYAEVLGLDEFKMGPYNIFMDLGSLNAYLMPAQKPMKVAIKEDIPMSRPDIPPYQQLIINGADNSRIAALHILGVKVPMQLVDQELPGVMNFINHDIEYSNIENPVLYTERIGSTWGWTVSGAIQKNHIFKTYWDNTLKIEENLVKERLIVLTSFVGMLGTAHLLKSIKIEGART